MRKLLDEKTLFEGPRFTVVRKTYERDDGLVYVRDCVNPGDAVVVLAIDENNNVIFEKQYREVVEGEQLEFPAGMVDPGEDPKDAARRELEEETGIRANKLTLLKEVFTSSGYSSEKIYIFLAEDLEEGIRQLDDTEEINEIVRLSIDDAMEHVLNNELPAACENLALLTYYYKFMY